MAAIIILKRNEERRIKSGHLWIFSNEIEKLEGQVDNGDIVEVFDSKQSFLGTGFYNKNSLIAVRLLSQNKIDDFHSFFKEKIINAFQLRKIFYPNLESFRMVFSESDFFARANNRQIQQHIRASNLFLWNAEKYIGCCKNFERRFRS